MALTRFALCLLLASSATLPVAAQQADDLPLAKSGEQLVLSAAGHQLTMPFPEWLDSQAADAANLREIASLTFADRGAQADLHIYPRGEGEALWTTVLGARILEQPDTDLSDLRSVVIDVYAQACRPETVALFQLEPDGDDTIPPLGFVCGSYLDLPGYEGKGEVMIMGFYKTDAGAGMVFQEWRGDAFNAADPAAWPVSGDEIEARINQFKTETAFAPTD